MIVLLDSNMNCDVNDGSKTLSHAYLIKAYVEGLYPYGDIKTNEETVDKKPKELSLFNA